MTAPEPKFCFIDTEFTGITESRLRIVSFVWTLSDKPGRYETSWVFENEAAQKRVRDELAALHDAGYIFVAFVAEAEIRAIRSLTRAPDMREYKWVDLYLEYRALLNRNNDLSYGAQFIRGEVVHTTPPPPKWERVENELDNDLHHKPQYSLAAACFKLLDLKVDTVEKDEVRDIIIRGDGTEIRANLKRIIEYNKSDVAVLIPLFNNVTKRLGTISRKYFLRHCLTRGEYAHATALMIEKGYPVDVERVRRFVNASGAILREAALAVNAEGVAAFSETKTGAIKMNTLPIKNWVEAQAIRGWRKTPKKSVSLSYDSFRDHFDSESPGFPGAFIRYLKVKQSMNGFLPSEAKKDKKTFWDFVGKDERVRPYFGIYGSQSSRSQPGATGFIFLKSHWMRCFVRPKSGNAIIGIDYASQEFLIAAVMSQDEAMMKAYASGDVYLAFAKESDLAPRDATKETHKRERDVAKNIVLGVSYDLSARGLAPRLSRQTGTEVTEERARELIQLFYDTYTNYADWKKEFLRSYESDTFAMLPDGWPMWGDNDNYRSVGNFPVQGMGAVIMRAAVKRAQRLGLDVIQTLHDAIYIECKSKDVERSARDLVDVMGDVFDTELSQFGKTVPIRMEGETWSPDFTPEVAARLTLPRGVVAMSDYVDGRGKADYEKYRKYFD